jgi:hypothetical protein
MWNSERHSEPLDADPVVTAYRELLQAENAAADFSATSRSSRSSSISFTSETAETFDVSAPAAAMLQHITSNGCDGNAPGESDLRPQFSVLFDADGDGLVSHRDVVDRTAFLWPHLHPDPAAAPGSSVTVSHAVPYDAWREDHEDAEDCAIEEVCDQRTASKRPDIAACSRSLCVVLVCDAALRHNAVSAERAHRVHGRWCHSSCYGIGIGACVADALFANALHQPLLSPRQFHAAVVNLLRRVTRNDTGTTLQDRAAAAALVSILENTATCRALCEAVVPFSVQLAGEVCCHHHAVAHTAVEKKVTKKMQRLWKSSGGIFSTPLTQRIGQWFMLRKASQSAALERRFQRLVPNASSSSASDAPMGDCEENRDALCQHRLATVATVLLLPPALSRLPSLENEEREAMMDFARWAVVRAATAGLVCSIAIGLAEIGAAWLVFGTANGAAAATMPSISELFSGDTFLAKLLSAMWYHVVVVFSFTGAVSTPASHATAADVVVQQFNGHSAAYWIIVVSTCVVASLVELLFLYFDSLGACYDIAAVAGLLLHHSADAGGTARRVPADASAADVEIMETANHAVEARDAVAKVRCHFIEAAVSRCALAIGHGTVLTLGVDVDDVGGWFLETLHKLSVLLRSSVTAAAARVVLGRVVSTMFVPFSGAPVIMLWNALVSRNSMRDMRRVAVAAVAAERLTAQVMSSFTQPTAAAEFDCECCHASRVGATTRVSYHLRHVMIRAAYCVGAVEGCAHPALHLVIAALMRDAGPIAVDMRRRDESSTAASDAETSRHCGFTMPECRPALRWSLITAIALFAAQSRFFDTVRELLEATVASLLLSMMVVGANFDHRRYRKLLRHVLLAALRPSIALSKSDAPRNGAADGTIVRWRMLDDDINAVLFADGPTTVTRAVARNAIKAFNAHSVRLMMRYQAPSGAVVAGIARDIVAAAVDARQN